MPEAADFCGCERACPGISESILAETVYLAIRPDWKILAVCESRWVETPGQADSLFQCEPQENIAVMPLDTQGHGRDDVSLGGVLCLLNSQCLIFVVDRRRCHNPDATYLQTYQWCWHSSWWPAVFQLLDDSRWGYRVFRQGVASQSLMTEAKN
jgi:hypothetical protein